MSLDLSKVVSQVTGLVASLKVGAGERREHLKQALNIVKKDIDIDDLRKKIAASKTSWLVAGLVDGLDQSYKAPAIPAEFTVIATDGSNIDVDRHQTTRCYLINTGSVILSYGAQPKAILNSSPSLYFRDEDLVIAPPGTTGREQPIEGALLGIKRGVEECHELARRAAELPPSTSASV